jgi:hypothetical protein
MTHLDCIDACIVLGLLFEEHEGCRHYLDNVGYKNKNKGLLTIPLIGEIFTNLLLKLPEKIPDPINRKVFMQSAIDFFDQTIMHFLKEKRIEISPMTIQDQKYVVHIKNVDYTITDDDAIHISTAISKDCQRFVTIDKLLLQKNCKIRIRNEFNLTITNPMKI